MRQGYRILGTAVLIGGLLLVSIPLAKWGVSFYYQNRALAGWEDKLQPALEDTVPDTSPDLPSEEPRPPEGLPDEEALLLIPKIRVKAAVIHGVSEADLKLGPGFYPQSSHPETGNVSIAGHRGVYGSWFRNLDRLEAGDEISLIIGDTIYRYTVRERFITHSRDWSVIDSAGKAELTLTTCLFTTTTKRMIVKADLTQSVKTLSE